VTNATIPATLMRLIDQTPPESFRGPALDTVWHSSSAEFRPVLSDLSVSPYAGMKHRPPDRVPTALTGPMNSIVQGNLHLIAHAKYGNQLYDWTRDPLEDNDLVNTPRGKAEASALFSELQAQLSNSATSRKSLSLH
jgi:hypothetical protein